MVEGIDSQVGEAEKQKSPSTDPLWSIDSTEPLWSIDSTDPLWSLYIYSMVYIYNIDPLWSIDLRFNSKSGFVWVVVSPV